MPEAERVTDVITHHGEGPFWDAQGSRLLLVDLLAGAVVELSNDGEVARHQVPSPVAAVIRRRKSGGFVIAVEHGVIAANDAFSEFAFLADFGLSSAARMNDGGCDPFGSFFVGSMAYDGGPRGGALYRLTSEGRIDVMLADVSISNGLQWSGDGRRVFYIDSPSRCVDVFDVHPETGEWSGRRTHLSLVDDAGVPDGMAIDEYDGLWIASWGGGAVNHYDSHGQFIERIAVPGVSQISSCAFGGRDHNVLYITTSRQGLSGDGEPHAGAVFAHQAAVRGAPVAAYFG